MSSLGSRLRRTLGTPEAEGADEAAPGADASARSSFGDELARRDPLGRRSGSVPSVSSGEPRSLEDAIGGRPLETPHGPVWCVEHRYPLGHHHGLAPLGAFHDRSVEHLPRLTADPRLEGRAAREALFLDIEATGLDHGAGTQAFLVGLAWYETSAWGHAVPSSADRELVVRQLLLRTPSEEEALLHALVERLEALPLLVSFNGKSYDLSVLQSRLVVHRFYTAREGRLKLRPHLDLLHLGRNLYRGRWVDTRLATLEEELLGFERTGDVPGSVVPSCWFHYLRTSDASPLAEAVRHNLYDVLSMVPLADRVVVDSRPEADPSRSTRVAANIGRLHLRRGDPAGAVAVLRPHLTSDGPARTADEAEPELLRQLATGARRTGEVALEREALERLAGLEPDAPEVARDLAVLEERRARRPDRALPWARRAYALRDDARSRRRVERLERRVQPTHRAPPRTGDERG